MKQMKKLASLLLALIMVLSMSAVAMADEKKDTTGTIVINGTDEVSVTDRNFNAYRILDLVAYDTEDPEATYYVYTVPADWKEFYVKQFALGGDEGDFDALVRDKIAEMTNDSEELYAFAKAALAYAKEKEIAVTATAKGVKTDDGSQAVFNDLKQGYYLIEDATEPKAGENDVVSALMLDTTKIDIDIKASLTTVDKSIVGADTKYTNGSIGDEIQFKLSSKVPDMRGYTGYTFTITDTMSKGLDFIADESEYPIVVTVNDIALTKVEAGYNAEESTIENVYNVYTLTVRKDDNGVTTITIDLPYIYNAGWTTGEPIEVTYYGRINEDADFTPTGNPNEVEIEYSNDPDGEGNPTGTTPKSEVVVYTTGLTLVKKDDVGNILTGAEFELTGTESHPVLVTRQEYVRNDETGNWYKLNDGTYTETAPTEENAASYEDGKYVLKDVSTLQNDDETSVTVKATVGEDGELTFEGLAVGEYIITETKSPLGYNLLKDSIYVKIAWEMLEEADEAAGKPAVYGWALYEAEYDKNGKVVKDGEAVKYNTEASFEIPVVNAEESEFVPFSIDVINTAGDELPSTGGIGTTIFYILGASLMFGAVVLLTAKKRTGYAE